MIIPINDRYRIQSDRYQWIIAKRRSRRGKEEWRAESFFRTFEMALRSLGEQMVRESKAQTLTDALTHVDHVATTLSQALTLEFEVGEGEIQKIRAGRQDNTCSAKE